ncbi:hypothetical protein [Mycobacteroides chelonae]|nr:hypothetical protein [Mycobacteroides chelonae]
MSEQQRHRIETKMDDLLASSTRSDADITAMIDGLLDDFAPLKKKTPPPIMVPELPFEEWAEDDAPPLNQPTSTSSILEMTAAGVGSEAKFAEVTQHPPAEEVDDLADSVPEWEQERALWVAPEPEPVDVPDDVAQIEPEPAPEPATPQPVSPPVAPAAPAAAPPQPALSSASDRGGVRDKLRTWWWRRTRGQRIATLAATALSVIVVFVLIVSGSGGKKKTHEPIDAPEPTATALAPAGVDDGEGMPLQPSNLNPHCYVGGSDPATAFGDDRSQAWICPGRYTPNYNSLDIYFKEPMVIYSITVVPGFDYVEPNGEDHWSEHRLVTYINWRIGGKDVSQPIVPTRGQGATLKLPTRPAASLITLTVQQTKPAPRSPNAGPSLGSSLGGGDKAEKSFAIGKITIMGRPAGGSTG